MDHMLEDDHLHDECGVVGIYDLQEAAYFTYLGLFALQHRGQEAAGIISHNGQAFAQHHASGLVEPSFRDIGNDDLPGNHAIGHVRYSTAGGKGIENAQPMKAGQGPTEIAVAHNGNIQDVGPIRERLEREGAMFRSQSDTEVVLNLIQRHYDGSNLLIALQNALTEVKGAYSMVLLTKTHLVAVRDPHGVRPLSLGRLTDPETGRVSWIVASESCAFDLLQAEFVRDINPGEVCFINDTGPKSYYPFTPKAPRPCIFEHVYFSRPDSLIFGNDVATMRFEFGRQLAVEHPVDADVVMAVPDSGNYAALGYAEESGIRFEMGIVRNHYIGRTFIQPVQQDRSFKVRVKLNPVKSIIRDRRIIVIDDSIVRGTTSKKLMAILREAGSREIHLRISSPPIRHCCYYGIDTPEADQLIANRMSIEEIRQDLGVTSLGFLSLEGMLDRAQRQSGTREYCTACWSGAYEVEHPTSRGEQLTLSLQHPE